VVEGIAGGAGCASRKKSLIRSGQGAVFVDTDWCLLWVGG
jgi:hypothetical protein